MEHSLDAASLAAEVRALEDLNIDGLRDEWRRRFKAPPPNLRAADLMRRFLADRIQIEALGRDEAVERKMSALVKAYARGERPRAPAPAFRPGVILEREYQDSVHRVEVLETGFRWQGCSYKSLSIIAREITGVRWNGPRFFGLREPKVRGAAA